MCPFAPFPVWARLNGHEWLKRRLADSGVGFESLDNGLRSCSDPEAAQAWADRLSGSVVREFLVRWLDHLPGPFQAIDRDLGLEREFSFRQVEFSDTAIFERPRDEPTGGYRTKVITPGVDPQIQIHYRSSKTKAYFKELHGVRVETTIDKLCRLRCQEDGQRARLRRAGPDRTTDQRPVPRRDR